MTDTTTREDLGFDANLPPTRATASRRRHDTPVEAFFHRFFALFYDKKIGLFLILAMTVLTLIGVLLPQVPAEVRADDVSYADWLKDVRGTFGGWTPVFARLGLFSMFSAPYFALVTVLLALSIIGCTVHRMPLLWRNATRPHLHVTESFFDHAKVAARVEVNASPQETLQATRRLLQARRHRVLDDPKGDGFSLYADRYRWMPFGTAIAHASFVILLVGMLITNNSGFSENIPVTVGTRAPVGHDTGLEVEAVSFRDTYHPDGQPMDYVSDVILYENGVRVGRQEVRVNSPLRHGNVKVHQAYFGTSAVITIKDAAGTTVFDGGVPLEYTSDDEQNIIGRTAIPGTDLLAFVVTPASGQVQSDIAAGEAQIQIEKMGQEDPIAGERVVPGKPQKIGDHTFTFEREAKFAGLMVNQDFGAPWVWLGCALMMIGLVTTMGFKHRRVWVRLQPTTAGTEVVAGSSDKGDIVFQRWFRDFAQELAMVGTSADHHRPQQSASTENKA